MTNVHQITTENGQRSDGGKNGNESNGSSGAGGAGKNVSTFIETIVEASEDAIITKTLDGMVMSWNKAAEEIFGYTSDEMVGDSIMVLFPPDRVDEENILLANIKEGIRVKHFETVRIRKDGKPIHVSVTLSPIKSAEGKVIGAAKIARDITERVELERMAKHYQAVIQSSFDAVITESLDGIVTTWNPAAQNIFEYKSEEIVGKSLRLLIPQELLREEEIILSKVGEGKTVHPFDTVRCTKSGTRVAVSVTASPIFDADNEKIVGVSKIVRVMGDKNRAYELLDRKAPRILVVEDNTDLRELIVESVNDLGADIYEAANGSEGVTKAKQLRPELVFMDMMMPGGIDGLEACRQIKADPFLVDHTKVIFVTARGHAYDREMAVRAGSDGYFLKPFSPKELRETARTILDEAKSQQGVL